MFLDGLLDAEIGGRAEENRRAGRQPLTDCKGGSETSKIPTSDFEVMFTLIWKKSGDQGAAQITHIPIRRVKPQL